MNVKFYRKYYVSRFSNAPLLHIEITGRRHFFKVVIYKQHYFRRFFKIIYVLFSSLPPQKRLFGKRYTFASRAATNIKLRKRRNVQFLSIPLPMCWKWLVLTKCFSRNVPLLNTSTFEPVLLAMTSHNWCCFPGKKSLRPCRTRNYTNPLTWGKPWARPPAHPRQRA